MTPIDFAMAVLGAEGFRREVASAFRDRGKELENEQQGVARLLRDAASNIECGNFVKKNLILGELAGEIKVIQSRLVNCATEELNEGKALPRDRTGKELSEG
jgi:hypothetical protein